MFAFLLALLPFGFLFLYGRWLYHHLQDLSYYLVPVWLLAGCLLLGALYQSPVFSQALLERYGTESAWFSDSAWYEPHFKGKHVPLMLLVLGPIAGFVLMIFLVPRDMVLTQAKHFIMLLLFLYPFLALLAVSKIGGARPKIAYGQPLPATGTRMPTRP